MVIFKIGGIRALIRTSSFPNISETILGLSTVVDGEMRAAEVNIFIK